MSEHGSSSTLLFRVTHLEKELDKLETRWDTSFTDLRAQLALLIRDMAVMSNEFHTHTKDVRERLDQLEGSVNEDVKGLRRVLIGAGISVLIGAVMFAITSLAVFGGPG